MGGVDFSLILVLATAASGLVWGGYALVRMTVRRPAGEGEPEEEPELRPVPTVVEYARSFFPVLLVVLLVRSFLYEPFRIPSSSMVPTLLVGDFIFVNKYQYGLRLPVTNTKIIDIGSPQRGDVVVFKLPSDPKTNYIKRLVGLPGDRITYRRKQLSVNGVLIPIEQVGRYTGGIPVGASRAIEQLGKVRHDVLLMPHQPSLEGTFTVPEGHYFMMGDNRDNSRDSRYPGVGYIPEQNVVGKAVRIWMNWSFPGAPLWSRIGDPII
jgi:signal peptidase I